MELITLTFKKLGNHWYLDIPHDNPSDLILDRRIELMLSRLDTWKEGIVTSVSLICHNDFIMALYINGHKWSISSKLYFLIEQKYKLDLHELVYKISVF